MEELILSILVHNSAGVLTRVSGLFQDVAITLIV